MEESSARLGSFQRNGDLGDLLDSLSCALKTARRPHKSRPDRPSLFIVGAPRTGSTYCLQWLAASGAFSYPSNFIARFWSAPFIGALVQEMMVNPLFDYRGELADIHPDHIRAISDVGKTTGMLSPSEFWFFWRAHFPSDGDLGLDISSATQDQFQSFRQELAHFGDVLGRPAVMKGKIINHQLMEFASGVPQALFLFMDRDPVDSVWSLLEARRRIYGSERRWWSFKTPDYEELKSLDPLEQVVGQVQSIRRDIQIVLDQLPSNRWIRVDYADLCADPSREFSRVTDLFAGHAEQLQGSNVMPAVSPSKGRVPASARVKIEQLLVRHSA